jgi:predicted transcriptional regulator
MGLKPPCEAIVQEIMPVIRSLVAKELVKNYKMTEVEVARRMGITQAAVSQYIYGKRGRRKRLPISLSELKGMAKDYAEMIAKEGAGKPGSDWFCQYCMKKLLRKKA